MAFGSRGDGFNSRRRYGSPVALTSAPSCQPVGKGAREEQRGSPGQLARARVKSKRVALSLAARHTSSVVDTGEAALGHGPRRPTVVGCSLHATYLPCHISIYFPLAVYLSISLPISLISLFRLPDLSMGIAYDGRAWKSNRNSYCAMTSVCVLSERVYVRSGSEAARQG